MRWLAVMPIALALAAPAAAQVVLYRCTAADGAVTLQNDRRCPKGQREERRVLETPAPRAAPAAIPAPVAAPAPIAPMPGNATAPSDGTANTTSNTSAASTDTSEAMSADATPVIELGTAPAPPVFACRTWDGQRYYGEDAQPAPRCAPLQAVGLDGRTATEAQACELRVDTCEPVLEAARCDAWAERLRAAEADERFGDAAGTEAARTEVARLRTLLAGTVCAR